MARAPGNIANANTKRRARGMRTRGLSYAANERDMEDPSPQLGLAPLQAPRSDSRGL